VFATDNKFVGVAIIDMDGISVQLVKYRRSRMAGYRTASRTDCGRFPRLGVITT
jgi:hypothetical protein